MLSAVSLFWFLYTFLICIGYCAPSQMIEVPAIRLCYERSMSFDDFVKDLYSTARDSAKINAAISKVYNRLYLSGQIGEMDGMNIGDLVIDFDPSASSIILHKYTDGHKAVKIQILCEQHTATIEEMQDISDIASARQLMLFTNALLPRLRIKSCSIQDNTHYKYVGCNGKQESISLIVLYAISGGTKGLYESFGYRRFAEQEDLGIAMLMGGLRRYQIKEIIFNGRTKKRVVVNNKLGEILYFLCVKDKCVFSRFYGIFKHKGVFDNLIVYNQGHRIKVFDENAKSEGSNIFHVMSV